MVQTAAGCCWERGLDHKQLKAQLLETQAAVGLRLKGARGFRPAVRVNLCLRLPLLPLLRVGDNGFP